MKLLEGKQPLLPEQVVELEKELQPFLLSMVQMWRLHTVHLLKQPKP